MNIHKTAFSVLAVGVVPGQEGHTSGATSSLHTTNDTPRVHQPPLKSKPAPPPRLSLHPEAQKRSHSLGSVPIDNETIVNMEDTQSPYFLGSAVYRPASSSIELPLLSESTPPTSRVNSESRLKDDLSYKSDARLLPPSSPFSTSSSPKRYRKPFASTSSADYSCFYGSGNSRGEWSSLYSGIGSIGSEETWSRDPFSEDTACLLAHQSPRSNTPSPRFGRGEWDRNSLKNPIRVTSL